MPPLPHEAQASHGHPGPDAAAAATDASRAESEALDPSQRHAASADLQRKFISLVSHELRTPLTAIQGAHFLMGRQVSRLSPEAGAPLSRLLRLQEDALKVLRDLVDQVLLLSRLEHLATQRPSFADGHPRDLIARIIGVFNDSSAEPRVDLDDRLPADFRCPFDPGLLRTAAENLISNALKYSAADRRVRVTLSLDGHGWQVVVSDEGRGLPAAEVTKLFQPFFRASNVGITPGTGLGLTIVRRVMDLHGGQVDFQSREGHGATVTLRFPNLPAA